jgi:hypothetical protein
MKKVGLKRQIITSQVTRTAIKLPPVLEALYGKERTLSKFTWGAVFVSIIVLVGSVTIALLPTAHEQWHSVKMVQLASESTETLITLEKTALAGIIKKVASYNSQYIENAESRIGDLKWVISVQGICILFLIAVLFLTKRKTAIKHV